LCLLKAKSHRSGIPHEGVLSWTAQRGKGKLLRGCGGSLFKVKFTFVFHTCLSCYFRLEKPGKPVISGNFAGQ